MSELLQAQLLQDININPVQPSISETNVNIITSGGPAEAGFNEFTPLFERNQVQFNGTAEIGNNDTFGGEGVVSAIYDRFSLSAGAFHHETDGWRPNHDIDHDIYNFFAQAAITPELNVQAEFRRRDSAEGDLALNFDRDDFSSTLERRLDQDMARAGLRYSPTPNSDVLVSFIYSDRKEEITETEDIEIFPGLSLELETLATADEDGYQVDAQYLYRRDFFNVIAGFAYSDVDSEVDISVTFGGVPVGGVSEAPKIEHARGYLYTNVNFPDTVTWTLGASYDDYHDEDPDVPESELDVEKLSPKFGVQWDITDRLRLRGALFRTVRPATISNRTIEPTQVAGLNQFFDNRNATAYWLYGGGLDWRPTNDLAIGGEVTWRDLDVPLFDVGGVVFEDQDEQLHRAYVYWTPLAELALSAELVYDRFEAEEGLLTTFADAPEEVETFSVPVSARYFHPSGLFAAVGATYVDQEVDRSGNLAGFADGSDDFFVVDAAIGWRIPDRRGIFSLEVRNLFDEEFSYQDDSFREFQDAPSIGPYFPDRTILGRVSLSF